MLQENEKSMERYRQKAMEQEAKLQAMEQNASSLESLSQLEAKLSVLQEALHFERGRNQNVVADNELLEA